MTREFAFQVARGFGTLMVWLALPVMVLGGIATASGQSGAREIAEGAILIGANGLLIERWFR